MERIQKIWEHPLYQDRFKKLQLAERERMFCNHTLQHFLDVARLMWIWCLEECIEAEAGASYCGHGHVAASSDGHGHVAASSDGHGHTAASSGQPICSGQPSVSRAGHAELPDRPLIYAAAFLHDIGRYDQISEGTPHEQAGADLAGIIMPACGFDAEETAAVQRAILGHRTFAEQPELLSSWLYRADKQSRPCYACTAAGECNWPSEKRNLAIRF